MKAIVAVLASGLLVMTGAAWAQDPTAEEICIDVTHKDAAGQPKTQRLTIDPIDPSDPISGAEKWHTVPAIFVHEEYDGRGTCTLSSMDCWVSPHDIIWIKAEGTETVMSRKRGDRLVLPEYDLPLTFGFGGRYAVATAPALGAQPAREIFLLPLKTDDCPTGWYPGTSHQCRYFRVEVFNSSSDKLDQDEQENKPSLVDNWIKCDAPPEDPTREVKSLADETDGGGSAHEPPK